MTAVNVYIAESSGVVSAAALGSEVQYFGLVMCYVKSYHQLICVVDSFFQNMERYWGNVLNCAFLFCRFLKLKIFYGGIYHGNEIYDQTSYEC